MVISFKPQFVQPIMQGTKTHTIREDKTNRYKPNKWLHFATGVRTKNYNCFLIETIVSTQTVSIFFGKKFNSMSIYVDDKKLSASKMIEFIKNDGFTTHTDFIHWFSQGNKEDKFFGKLIHWTDLKY